MSNFHSVFIQMVCGGYEVMGKDYLASNFYLPIDRKLMLDWQERGIHVQGGIKDSPRIPTWLAE